MSENCAVRNRKQRRYDKAFVFMCDETLLDAARKTASENCLSVASFIRQSVKRNISAYERHDQ